MSFLKCLLERPVTRPEMMRGRHVHCKFFPKKFFLLTSSSRHFYCLQGGLKVVQPIFNLFIHNSNIGGPALLLEYENLHLLFCSKLFETLSKILILYCILVNFEHFFVLRLSILLTLNQHF